MLVFISTLRPNCYDSPLIMSPAQLAEESYYFLRTLVLLKMTSLLVWGAPGPASSVLLSPDTSACLTWVQSQARAVSWR